MDLLIGHSNGQFTQNRTGCADYIKLKWYYCSKRFIFFNRLLRGFYEKKSIAISLFLFFCCSNDVVNECTRRAMKNIKKNGRRKYLSAFFKKISLHYFAGFPIYGKWRKEISTSVKPKSEDRDFKTKLKENASPQNFSFQWCESFNILFYFILFFCCNKIVHVRCLLLIYPLFHVHVHALDLFLLSHLRLFSFWLP